MNMATLSRSVRRDAGKSILDLAPLELECMKQLWPIGEASVRDIRDALAISRPRAYTTIMTIMDRLAQKGVVARRLVGRAYLYRPNFTAEEARARALGRLVEHYFSGSTEALLQHLSGGSPPVSRPGPVSPPGSPGVPPDASGALVGEAAPSGEGRIDETLL